MSSEQPEGMETAFRGARGLTSRTARAIVSLFLIAFIVAAASLVLTSREIAASNHRWCATLITLDNADQAALHASPSQKPKGAYSLALIRDFHQLRRSLGCG